MSTYPATLERVINGSTIELNITIGGSQVVKRVVRLKEIKTGNIQKTYHLSFTGGERQVAELEVKRWFYELDNTFKVTFTTIDICGRILGEIVEDVTGDNLNDYLKSIGLEDERWGEVYQEDLKDDWFAGETVTIPDGDELPIFHIWGKPVFLGMESTNLKWIE